MFFKFLKKKKTVLNFVFQFFGHTLWYMESQFPDQGSDHAPALAAQSPNLDCQNTTILTFKYLLPNQSVESL